MMAVLRTHRSRLSSTAIAAIVSSPGVTPHHAAGDRAAPAATTRVRLSCAVAPPPRLPTGYPRGAAPVVVRGARQRIHARSLLTYSYVLTQVRSFATCQIH